ncbi:MAG TPA: PDZ domain-containing protein [Chitinophagales bacterium]|nr:PDZ domain-containing protein [Chitinophagales bacterium]
MQQTYTLSFPAPHTHYTHVNLALAQINIPVVTLRMAVWTPGSYLVREFAKQIDAVDYSFDQQQWQRAVKTDKNTWQIATNGQSHLYIRYDLYCFEHSVRTNYIDVEHAVLNGAATFLFVEGAEKTPKDIHIIAPENWHNISTTLETINQSVWQRRAADLDELIDSPIEIGNHLSYFFDAADVPHELAIYGSSNCNTEKLIADLKKIIEVETAIFGGHPCNAYTFFIQHTDNTFGGLEHLHSSLNHVARWSYEPKKYQQAISLLAHEYFHLWNVKRIRPKELGPFNYHEENYTELLWFFEGVTSYYDDYICYRAGVTTQEDYLSIVAKNINTVVNTAGIDTQTLAEASWDTWLKYYRRTENSNNTQVSYYTQGAVVAMLFDFIIIQATDGQHHLDDVMKALYQRYLQRPEEGITQQDLINIFSEVSGLDFKPYFQQYIYNTPDFSPEPHFEQLGLTLKDTTPANKVYLGLYTQWKDGRLMITELDKNYGAYQSGLNVHDEIVAIDLYRVTQDFTKLYAHKKAGEFISVTVSRQGVLKTIPVLLSNDKRKQYELSLAANTTEKALRLRNKWLSTN